MGKDTPTHNKSETALEQGQIAARIHEKTGMLIEALPFMRRYSDKALVIKFGGHAMGEADYVNAFAADIALLDHCLLYTSPSPRDRTRSRMPSSA